MHLVHALLACERMCVCTCAQELVACMLVVLCGTTFCTASVAQQPAAAPRVLKPSAIIIIIVIDYLHYYYYYYCFSIDSID